MNVMAGTVRRGRVTFDLEHQWLRCFFFSSRRRHTIFDCDWSSDVCSSDLLPKRGFNNAAFHKRYAIVNLDDLNAFKAGTAVNEQLLRESKLVRGHFIGIKILEIGRASCRERV